MSDLSSLNLDESIEKSSLIDTLRQPIWIALFTSVIIHAILGVNLPKLSLFSEKAKLPPTVGFVELTPEQLERLPQPEEPEIIFSTIPKPGNFSLIAPPTPGEAVFVPQSPSSELPTIPVDPSDYNLPKLPPLDSIDSSSPLPSISTPSVSRLPKNPPPKEFYDNPPISSLSPSLIKPTYKPPLPLPSASPPPTFQPLPPLIVPENTQDEYQIRKEIGLTVEVYESGLSRRPTLEMNPTDGTSVGENSTGESYSDNLILPPRRYQDKYEVKNPTVITPTENNTNTQPQKTPLPLDPTKKNRLSEAPIVKQVREGKTIEEIAQEMQQKVVVIPTPTKTQKSESKPEKKFEQLGEQQSPETSPPVQLLTQSKGSLLQTLQKENQANAAAVREDFQSRGIALGASLVYMEWARELEVGEESLTQPKAISGIYPEAACEQRLEGKAMVGVFVGPDGSISAGPKLLLKSGYSMLDKAALDAVNKESFDSSDESKLYQYEFDFNSSNCTN
ncbi:MAG: TonB family protein [Trichodesmium sp. St16_bin2-tuft]|nr:TonB family protein [Trichodesmium sp. St16_bin2-tuft]